HGQRCRSSRAVTDHHGGIRRRAEMAGHQDYPNWWELVDDHSRLGGRENAAHRLGIPDGSYGRKHLSRRHLLHAGWCDWNRRDHPRDLDSEITKLDEYAIGLPDADALD